MVGNSQRSVITRNMKLARNGLYIAGAHAEGGGIWTLGGGGPDVEWVTGVERYARARFNQFAISAGASAVFSVQVRLNYVVDDGYAGFDPPRPAAVLITSQFQLELTLQPH